ncbi:paired amphipathic helix [Schizophyllum amplum]|uniref:Paired amphipathic helix n=1 Tax=Schizophyllum amplum TaxID=97359 RepID=A0A550CSC9_9AGAR|nr:paired amphipathic helix [Auriculariopsis ampla]
MDQRAAHTSRDESTSSRGPPPTPPLGTDLDVSDALSYLDTVKACFRDRPEVYREFLDAMKDLKNQSIDIRQCVDRVVELFRGYPDLIVGFNVFLPRGSILDPNTFAVVRLPGS